MANPKSSPESQKKTREALKAFHENPNKPTSANSVKVPRALGNLRRQLTDLIDPSAQIIRKAVTGGLVKSVEVWKGKPEDKITEMEADPSVSFEYQELENGIEVEVIVRWVPVSKDRVEIAKWVIKEDAALKKASEESKVRRLEIKVREQNAKDRGIIPKEDPIEKAREAAARGEHIKSVAETITEWDDEWDVEPEFDDED